MKAFITYALAVLVVLYYSCTRETTETDSNITNGLICLFLTLSIESFVDRYELAYTRPHPKFWTFVNRVCIFYACVLVLIACQHI
jgi:hypothetical protein